MKENQVEKVYRLISDMIFKYQLPLGVFFSDFTLSKILGMSRTSTPLAIMILLNCCLVSTTEKAFKVPDITLDSIDEFYDVRLCLEPAILRFSMQRGIEKSSIALFREKIELECESNASENIIEILDYDIKVCKILSSLCQNQQLKDVYSILELLMKKLKVFLLAVLNLDTPRIYTEVYNSIEAGDFETAGAKLEALIELGRLQKKNAIEKFKTYGLRGFYNFIANSFEFSY